MPVSVSVLSANYNNGRFLHDYFASLLASSRVPDEVVMVDDASTDGSLEIIAQYAPRFACFRLIALHDNVGFANALNIGLQEVSGFYTIRLDPDDMALPGRIARQVELLDRNPACAIVGSNVLYFRDDSAKPIRNSDLPLGNDGIRRVYRQGGHGLAHSGVCIRTEVYKSYCYNQENVPSEEYDIFSRILRDGHRAMNIDEPCTLIRIHPASLSHNISFDDIRKLYRIRTKIWGIQSHATAVLKTWLFRRLYRSYLSATGAARLPYAAGLLLLRPARSLKSLLGKARLDQLSWPVSARHRR